MRIGHRGIVQRDGWHVKTAKLLSEQAAEELLAVHPAAQLTATDDQVASALAVATEGMLRSEGPQ